MPLALPLVLSECGLWALYNIHTYNSDAFSKLFSVFFYFIIVAGLQDLEVCTFDQPVLCNYDTNHTSGSRYAWKLMQASDRVKTPLRDADGNEDGASFIYYAL